MERSSENRSDNSLPWFIAIPLPERLTGQFIEIQDSFKEISEIRITPAVNLHITLLYLGRMPVEYLNFIKASIRNRLEAFKEFSLRFKNLEFRKRRDSSGLIWARYEYSDEFRQITEAIHHTLKGKLDLQKLNNKPVPHVTLARTKGLTYLDKDKLNPGEPRDKDLIVRYAGLWESNHGNSGVYYKRLQEFVFKTG